jgi:hypothetical protein
MKEILEIQPEAVFIQSESSQRTHAVCNCEETQKRADWENQVRFLPFDLLYCHQVRADVHGWLWRQWQNLLYMRERGIPVLGFTWYSLIDQVDWDTELREANNRVNPFGLYDMNRKIRPVGEAYKQIIKEYDEISVVPRSGILSVT